MSILQWPNTGGSGGGSGTITIGTTPVTGGDPHEVTYIDPTGSFLTTDSVSASSSKAFIRNATTGEFNVSADLDNTLPFDISTISLFVGNVLSQPAYGAYLEHTKNGGVDGTTFHFVGHSDLVGDMANGMFMHDSTLTNSANIAIIMDTGQPYALIDSNDAVDTSGVFVSPDRVTVDTLIAIIGDDTVSQNGTIVEIRDDTQSITFFYGVDSYTFPIGDGTPNQVLETNGAGQLSWVTPSFSASLTETQVGFGDASDQLTGGPNFTWIDLGGLLRISASIAGSGILTSNEATGVDEQGGNLSLSTGLGTGTANSATLNLNISTKTAVSGSAVQSQFTVFTAHMTDVNGPFISIGDPNNSKGQTKIIIGDAAGTLDFQLDDLFTIKDVAGNRWFTLSPSSESLTIGKIDTGSTNMFIMQNDVSEFYCSAFYLKAGPSPTGGTGFEFAHDGTDTYTIIGDQTGSGTGAKVYISSAEQKMQLLDMYLQEGRSADVASAAEVDLGVTTGNFLHITGNDTIERMNTPTNFLLSEYGARLTIEFDGNLTIVHNASSGTAGYVPWLLSGSMNRAVTAGTIMQIVYDNQFWKEVPRVP